MPGRFALIPNARPAIASATSAPASDGRRLRLAYDIELQASGAAAPGGRIAVTGEVLGPGDVVGFDRSIISRIEPTPGLVGFEPNYVPFVEFVDADFPWRYTLDTATGPRARPWIVLVALKPAEFEFVDQGRAPFPRIRVLNPAASLPELADSWGFAHVQVDLETGAPAGVAEALAARPAAGFSRLLCPRRVEERTVYHLFLVPAWEAGRLAGIGAKPLSGSGAPAWNAPAWTDGGEPVELPAYFQSRFTTNELEDVETLLRRLRPVSASEAAAITAPPVASAARPGYYGDYRKPAATFEVQSALRRPGAAAAGYDTDPALATRLAATLADVIAGEAVGSATDGPDREDPLVAMPPYGWRFRHETAVSPARAAQGRWFDLTNLDLKFRHAAGVGAETVRRDQETFAQRCWNQYEAIVEANQKLARLRVAELLVERTTARRFDRLPPDVAVTLAEPVQPYVQTASGTLLEQVRAGGVPSSSVSRALRRLASKRPIHVETVPAGAPRGSRDRVTAVVAPMPPIPGDRTPGLAETIGGRAARPARVTRRRGMRPSSEAATVEPSAFRPGIESRLEPILGVGAFAGAHRPRSFGIPVAELASASLQAAVSRSLTLLPALKADFVVGGRLPQERETLDPVYRSPVVPVPLATWLERHDPDRLIANVAGLPQNSVSLFEENRRFVEALLVGANHEMNHELRWREFPTDMRGTIFHRFWDRGRAADDQTGDDIADIHTWRQKLGSHPPVGAANADAELVVVIRGEIIRKLGQLIVVLNQGTSTTWQQEQGTDHEPVFLGRIGADVAYYGFDVPRAQILAPSALARTFLVLHEPVGRLRFGLDIATAQVRRKRRRYNDLALAFPVRTLDRSYEMLPSHKPGLFAPPPTVAATWDDLSWTHVDLGAAGYIDFDQTIAMAGQPDWWGSGATSASIARALWQKPLAAVLPLARVL